MRAGIIFLALTIAPLALGAPTPHKPIEPLPFNLPLDGTLVLTIHHGQITIIGSDRDRVSVEELRSRNPRKISISQKKTPGTFTITTTLNMNQREFQQYVKRATTRRDVVIRLRVPKQYNVRISNLYGSTTIRDMEGAAISINQIQGKVSVEGGTSPVRIQTVGGNISIESTNSPVSITTQSGQVLLTKTTDGGKVESISGDITIRNGEGMFELSTKSGNISTDYLHGGLAAKSKSGLIFEDHMNGFVTAESEHGEVEVVLADDHQPVPLKLISGNGDVKIHIPRKLKATLFAESKSGSIYSGVPIRPRDDQHLKGRLRGGGEMIALQTESGDISLLPR